jgi:hypothetical protein
MENKNKITYPLSLKNRVDYINEIEKLVLEVVADESAKATDHLKKSKMRTRKLRNSRKVLIKMIVIIIKE